MTDQTNYQGVSATWKETFQLIDRAGGVKLPKLRELSSSDRRRIQFNWLAFLFGPFYYLTKGMWRKAITYSAIIFALIFALLALGLKSSAGFGVAFGIIWAMLANISYYKIKVLGQNPWL